jgi:glycosyltransferase involved in cell wall biosynthesis
MNVTVIIPALNQTGRIGQLITAALAPAVLEEVVVDNGWTDATAEVALRAGSRVVAETRRGDAWRAAVALASGQAEALVFPDGDYSFAPDETPALLAPLQSGKADLVLGLSALGSIQRATPSSPPRFGNGCIREYWP